MPDMGSFGAVPFGVRIDGADRTTESEFAGMHIPGSDIAIIDKGGKLPEQLSYELYFAASTAYDDMRAKVGTSDTLTAFDLTFTAYLMRLKRTFVSPIGVHPTIATADFVEDTEI